MPNSSIDHPMQSTEAEPPYAVLSMFDGCGSSLDILIEKFGYRPKVCLLCERDETLRYLVAEKHGISVNVQWIHSLKGGIFYYANDVDLLFDDKAMSLSLEVVPVQTSRMQAKNMVVWASVVLRVYSFLRCI